jgi:iron complex outermembrane recepter protein
MASNLRLRLLTSTFAIGAAAFASTPAFAQPDDDQGEATPTTAPEPGATSADGSDDVILVTGSRIARPNLDANSPIAVVSGEELVEQADITVDTYLNTLPQVNPAGTTTSNNPGNNGQANIDLRGLGANRNLVLIDGRRPMPSNALQVVDINTIPQGLIERVEVVTGGAGATYGADAIAGVVNFILRSDFSGIELNATYSNSIPEMDAREYRISGLFGLNSADGRGNLAIAVEVAERQQLIKNQRGFSINATSTTPTPPTGRFIDSSPSTATGNPGNPVPLSAVQALFLTYGVPTGSAPTAASQIHFNSDGTLFGGGTFNTPINVVNYRYDPAGRDAAAANQLFFPDLYSYNFDAINLLVLPLERKSAFVRGNYELTESIEFFTQGGYTEYDAVQALAPTPVGVPIVPNGSQAATTSARSGLLTPGLGCQTATGAASECSVTGLIIPTTNPFIPAALRTLLNARTGDDRRFVGSGATEPFNIAYRFLNTGLRESTYTNEVIQGLAGLRGRFAEGWRYEAYYSWGRTTIDQAASGNINVQNMQTLLERTDGGTGICAGGFNPFGIQPLSQACIDYLDETGNTTTVFRQEVASAYVQGDLVALPAGNISAVLGVESRRFVYEFDPGALSGPIAGFNTQAPINGTNNFFDIFGELYVPLLRDRPWAQNLDLTLGYRRVNSQAANRITGIEAPDQDSDSYKVELSWAPIEEVRFRGTYQRAVRAPNFNELFSAGSSFPQYFDPCSVGTDFRTRTGAQGSAFCQAQGVPNPATFVAIPGSQAPLNGAANINLTPEKADTFTAGAVFRAMGFTGSIDFYHIKVTDLIRLPDPQLFIAACFNYLGGANPNLANNNPFCTSINRAGGAIGSFSAPPGFGNAQNNYIRINAGSLETSGIDFQLGYRLPTEFIGERSALNFNLLLNYLISFKESEIEGITVDYAGTAGYFGQGLSNGGGASHPRWRGTFSAAWDFGGIALSTRLRYIDSMRNRASAQFPGEPQFTGPKSILYTDFALEANIENYTFRIGVNNAFNVQPPEYAPNVQSGTDPSLYDVVGRRGYVSVRLRF